MGKAADSYYAMSNAALWYAFRDGWTGAAAVLIDRFGGRAPIEARSNEPLAVVWADLLTAPVCPFECDDVVDMVGVVDAIRSLEETCVR